MKISFDLDDTLIPYQKKDFEIENRTFFHKILQIEPLRKDTILLFKNLKNNGHSIGIYTTSFRKNWKIKLQFLSYGFNVDFVINQYKNNKLLRKNSISASKHPPSFKIDLHIDDSKGVKLEGEKYNFKTIIISKNDLKWQEIIKSKINS
ncbi:hypothetical protein [Aureivirga marina]|uniref:hypothetical protein n=1 Tax=Aureivirga marina TaxID=1182451 RepID=UPI0018CA78FD|nr:hypothetical protein [Aureivirga marina]